MDVNCMMDPASSASQQLSSDGRMTRFVFPGCFSPPASKDDKTTDFPGSTSWEYAAYCAPYECSTLSNHNMFRRLQDCGPVLFAPLVQGIGRSSTIFSSLLGAIAAQVWAGRMTGPDDSRTPEYRLWSIFLPAVLSRIGLGIFGAWLQYHLHYMVLALGTFLVKFSALPCVPVCIYYVVECFIGYPAKVSVIMNVYRLTLGLSLTFYIEPWYEAVGVV